MYETGSVCSQARSLWRVQHVKVKWYGGFMGYGKPVRIRHVTSGRYLGVTADKRLVTLYRLESNTDSTIFLLRDSKVGHCAGGTWAVFSQWLMSYFGPHRYSGDHTHNNL